MANDAEIKTYLREHHQDVSAVKIVDGVKVLNEAKEHRFAVHYFDGVGSRHAVVVATDTEAAIAKLKKQRKVSRAVACKQISHDYIKEQQEGASNMSP
jgi:hypothetical protein